MKEFLGMFNSDDVGVQAGADHSGNDAVIVGVLIEIGKLLVLKHSER